MGWALRVNPIYPYLENIYRSISSLLINPLKIGCNEILA
jgi:hypothetical protein